MLFDDEELIPWKAEWQDMPEYSHEDLAPKYQLIVNFATEQDMIDFGETIGQRVVPGKSKQTKSIWFPEQEIAHYMNKRYKRDK